MSRVIRGAVIQATLNESTDSSLEKIKKSMIDKHVTLLEEAGDKIDKSEEIIRSLVLAVEKFRSDSRDGRFGEAAKQVPDIARLIQAFAEAMNTEKDLSGYVNSITGKEVTGN